MMNLLRAVSGSQNRLAIKTRFRGRFQQGLGPHKASPSVLPLLGIATFFVSVLASTSAQALTSRVVGGSDLSLSTVPATVAVLNRHRVELDGDFRAAQTCGGTVIGKRWVLTAAHCMITENGELSPSDVMVLIGSEDLDNPDTQPVDVSRIIIHERFVTVPGGYDIALLQLESDTDVTPAILDTQPVEENEVGLVAGWGAVTASIPFKFDAKLQGALVDMTPGEFCSAYRFTDSRFVCALPVSGSGGTCDGDSGGPLYRVTDSNLPVESLVGITSFKSARDGCSGQGDPAGFTHIVAYADWISDKAGITAPEPETELPPIEEPPTEQPVPVTQGPAGTSGIELDGEGWWQVLRSSDFREFYQGRAQFVELPEGIYNVINLSTGFKSSGIVVESEPTDTSEPTPDTSESRGIQLAGEGWWQIQSSNDFIEFYQGRAKFVDLPRGTYNIINHSTGVRESNIAVR